MLVALAPLFLALPVAPFQEDAPGDAVVIWSAGLESVAPDARDAKVVETIQGIDTWLTTLQEALETPVPMGPRLASRWTQRPFDFRFGITGEGAPSLHAAVSFDSIETAEGEAALLREALSDAGLELRSSGDAPSSFWATTSEGPLAVTTNPVGDGAVIALAINRRPESNLPRPSMKALGDREPALVASYDGRQLLAGLEALAAKEDGDDAEARKVSSVVFSVLDRLDLVGERTPVRTWAMSHGTKESLTLETVEGWSSSWAGERGAVRLSREDLGLFPRDAAFAWMGNLHPSVLTEVARAVEPEKVEQGLAMVTAMTGVDLEQDFLSKIGPVCGAYAAHSAGASALMGLVLFSRSEDPTSVTDTLETLIESIPGTPEEKPFRVETWDHEGRQCTSLAFPGMPVPVEPSFAATEDVVFLAMGRNALRQALDQVGSETSLLAHPRLAKLSDRVFNELVGFSFLDSPACVQKGYASVSMALAGLSNMAQGSGAPDLSDLLPTGSKLAEGLRPTLSLTYVRGEDLLTIKAHDRSWVARGVAAFGSPVGEANPLMAGMAASIAIPKLLTARISANESAAVATLRATSSAQAQINASGFIDGDGDGFGEFGLFGELSGARPVRATDEYVNPPVLSQAFGALQADGQGGAVVMRSGYYFQVWLPGTSGGAVCDSPDGTPGRIDSEGAERRWCAYAWPTDAGTTGNRAFYVDQTGDVLFVNGGTYSGLDAMPSFDAASYEAGAFGSKAYEAGTESVDGNYWMVVN